MVRSHDPSHGFGTLVRIPARLDGPFKGLTLIHNNKDSHMGLVTRIKQTFVWQ